MSDELSAAIRRLVPEGWEIDRNREPYLTIPRGNGWGDISVPIVKWERPAPAPATGTAHCDHCEAMHATVEKYKGWLHRKLEQERDLLYQLRAALASPAGVTVAGGAERCAFTHPDWPNYPKPCGQSLAWHMDDPNDHIGHSYTPPMGAVPQAGAHTDTPVRVGTEACPHVYCDDCAPPAPAPTVTPAAVREAVKWLNNEIEHACLVGEEWNSVKAAAEAYAAAQQQEEAGC